MIKLLKGDCLELLPEIETGSVDCIITDPPYGTTACKWDTVIPFEPMWEEINRVIKSNGATVLFGSEPFSSALRMSNIKNYKYDWIWEKSKGSNFVHANFQPLKVHEIISVFSFGGSAQGSKNPIIYNPQYKEGKPYNKGIGHNNINTLNGGLTKSDSIVKINYTGKRCPRSVIYNKTLDSEGRLHPTQKPVALIEYLIKTYTNENETILDFTIGSGTTAIAAMNIDRNFIGIEKNEEYFNLANERIKNHVIQKQSENLLDQFMEI